ncbi:HAD family hydrolase [Terriglobus aquaticus]|uniref:phosphoglycolate phosphatase n=1 Tax=Terriglobus aquaticus TaxID=940139 RepID=A0ABW9KKR2_9BACT|nr:HAD hydrolase-like protein [Terriglobus aquaticus]
MNRPELLIFDLDGTLIDSRRDLVECVNASLVHCGLPHLPAEHIASFIGDGAAALVERSLAAAGGDPHLLQDEALRYFLSFYREHLLDHTAPYPGVLAALQQIRNLDSPPLLAVLTNKPVNPSHRICDALHLTPLLFANFGGNSFATKKPDPEGLLALWRNAETILGHMIAPERVVLIGDSEVDVRTARNAGVLAWGCTWGFAKEKMLAESPDALAHSPADWLALLQASSTAD